jgi:hypothetical protein
VTLRKIKKIAKGAAGAIGRPIISAGRALKVPANKCHQHIRPLVKTVHNHTVRKPHLVLSERLAWYKKWHSNKYHTLVHASLLAIYLIAIIAVVLVSFNKITHAGQSTTVWEFEVGSNYVYDDTLIEIYDTSIRLKVPFSTAKPTVNLANSVMKSGVINYDNFITDETDNGGTLTYRLSDDGGVTWKYWDGADWVISNSVDNANDESTVDTNIPTFPVTFKGINWQAIFTSDGTQQVTLNSLTIIATTDEMPPDTVKDNIIAQKVKDGPVIDFGGWTNGSSPYFSWEASSDTESQILGYCLYLGHDLTADLSTTGGMLGSSPIDGGDVCQYVVPDINIDLANPGVLASPLTSSTEPYYLLISAIDKAGNVSVPTTFSFNFDNTTPTNPDYISGPTTFISSKNATLTWEQSAIDNDSGVLGMQYNINNTEWYGEAHTGAGDITDILDEDGSYTTDPDYDYPNIHDGINTIYFRTWDNAGNISETQLSVILKVNTTGSPAAPQSLTVNPTGVSEDNLFSFQWSKPATFYGEEEGLDYCYTVNTLPSEVTCSYSGPGVTSLEAGPYATQPGANTFYVVAKDETDNINYDNYASIVFTANTYSPGIVSSIEISDVSTKATSNWRLAITWDVPENVGIGISKYTVYRSADNENFETIGNSTSTTYVDAGLAQQTYYYYVIACDSTNNCGSDSPVVSLLPTGRFVSPAILASNPEAGDITTKRATVSWTTDRASDSRVLLGTASGSYGDYEVGASDQVIAHKIELDSLAPGTTYYAKVTWTDIDENMGESQEFSFITAPAPVVKEIKVSSLSISNATVDFTSVGASKVSLYYGESDSFGGLKTINTSPSESKYSLTVPSLKDNTKYYYRLSSFDSEGSRYDGNVFSFTTPPRPRISSLRFQPVKGEPTSTQSITWTTNVPASSTITYGIEGTAGADVQFSKLVTSHEIIINGLDDNSSYFLIAQSRDADGNLAESDRQTFKTAMDTRPPEITDINIESTIIGTGAEARGQIVASWNTDEPSTSQVGYAEGAAATIFGNKTSEDMQLTTSHTVVISDLPTSKVYSIQVMSYDVARNQGLGLSQPTIIGHADDSVLTVILTALQRIFGL